MQSSMSNIGAYAKNRHVLNFTQGNISQGSYNSTNVNTRQSSQAISKKRGSRIVVKAPTSAAQTRENT